MNTQVRNEPCGFGSHVLECLSVQWSFLWKLLPPTTSLSEAWEAMLFHGPSLNYRRYDEKWSCESSWADYTALQGRFEIRAKREIVLVLFSPKLQVRTSVQKFI